MAPSAIRPPGPAIAAALLALCACGARTSLDAADVGGSAGGGPGGGGPAGPHRCRDASWSAGIAASPLAIAADPDGGVVLAGCYLGDVQLGGFALHGGQPTHFLARVAPDGSVSWARSLGDRCLDEAVAVAVGPGGEVVLAGVFRGEVSLDDGPLAAGPTNALLVARLADGALRGVAFPFHTPPFNAQLRSIVAAVSGGGDIAVGFPSNGAIAIGPGVPGGPLAVVARLAPDLSVRFVRAYGETFDTETGGVAWSTDGSLLVGGFFYTKADFGTGVVHAKGLGKDGFVVSLDPGGGTRWLAQLAGHDSDGVESVAPAPDGGVWVAGSFIDTIPLGSTTLVGNGTNDQYLARLDAAGNVTFAERLHDAPFGSTTVLAAGPNGEVFGAGSFFGDNTLAGVPLSSVKHSDDAWVARFAASGPPAWACGYGGRDVDVATAVAPAADGAVWVAGRFSHDIDFGAGHLSTGDGPAFLVRFPP